MQSRNKIKSRKQLALSLLVSRQSGPPAASGRNGRPYCREIGSDRGSLRVLLRACVSIESAQVLIFYRSKIKETVFIIDILKIYSTYLPKTINDLSIQKFYEMSSDAAG